jgi:hypothetical protein
VVTSNLHLRVPSAFFSLSTIRLKCSGHHCSDPSTLARPIYRTRSRGQCAICNPNPKVCMGDIAPPSCISMALTKTFPPNFQNSTSLILGGSPRKSVFSA